MQIVLKNKNTINCTYVRFEPNGTVRAIWSEDLPHIEEMDIPISDIDYIKEEGGCPLGKEGSNE